MSGKKDNAARKYGQPSAEEQRKVDEGWERPEDKFAHTPSKPPKPDDLRKEVGAKAKEAGTPSPDVSSEDLDNFSIGQVLLEDKVNDVDVGLPLNMFVKSGPEKDPKPLYMFFGRGVLCAKTSTGHTPTNRDSVMASHDAATGRFRVVLGHGPQNDKHAADLATVAAVKAGIEDAVHPNASLGKSFKRVIDNVDSVKAEFGIGHKPVSVTEVELTLDDRENIHPIRFANQGNNHCIILNPESGEVRKVALKREFEEGMVSKYVLGGEIVIIANDELVKSIEAHKGEHGVQLLKKIFFNKVFDMQLQIPLEGKGLRGFCDDVVSVARNRQVDEKRIDTSLSIIAFQVPDKEEFPPYGDPKTVDEILGGRYY